MGFAIGLRGIAKLGFTCDHKQCYHQIGFRGGTSLGDSLEPLLQLSLIALAGLLLEQQVAAQQHQRREALVAVSIDYLNVGIAQQANESRTVPNNLIGILLAILMTEDVDHLILEVLDEVATEQATAFLVGKQHIAIVKILELNTLRPVHDIYTYRHDQTTFFVSNLLDLANLATPRRELHNDRVAHCHIAYGLTEEELQLAALQCRAQLLHLVIGNGDHTAIGVAIVMQMGTGTGIPLGTDDVVDALLGDMYEDKAAQVFTQLFVGGGAQELIRYKEIVRGQLAFALTREFATAVFQQHGLNPPGILMNHDIPALAGSQLRIVVCIVLFCHICTSCPCPDRPRPPEIKH